MAEFGTQAAFFEIDANPTFESLFQKMKQVKISHLKRRVPRFDHLENVSRAHDFYISPIRFYSEENPSGPLDGVTYLFLDDKYRKNKKEIEEYFKAQFPQQWNGKVDKKYIISRPQRKLDLKKRATWAILVGNYKDQQEGGPNGSEQV